ncbi:MAG: CPCC family cysteine-rich protein [Armatimonadetes bacterium]|nr:CPCC family cysteine-rich protein [Armatimonadota bacterium]
MSKHACHCCGYLTLAEEPGGSFEICPVCFWEDDLVQSQDPDFDGGANQVSLNRARENFKQYGASDEASKSLVRRPLPDVIPSGEL